MLFRGERRRDRETGRSRDERDDRRRDRRFEDERPESERFELFCLEIATKSKTTLEIVSAIITHFVWNDTNDKLLYT